MWLTLGTFLVAGHQRCCLLLLLLKTPISDLTQSSYCLLRASQSHLRQWPHHNHSPLAQWPQTVIHLHLSSIWHNLWSTLKNRFVNEIYQLDNFTYPVDMPCGRSYSNPMFQFPHPTPNFHRLDAANFGWARAVTLETPKRMTKIYEIWSFMLNWS